MHPGGLLLSRPTGAVRYRFRAHADPGDVPRSNSLPAYGPLVKHWRLLEVAEAEVT